MSYLQPISNYRTIVANAEKKVCEVYGLDPKVLKARTRRATNAQARFAVWYILSTVHRFSFSHIARLYKYNMSAVWNGIRRAKVLGIPAELGLKTVDRK